MSAGGRKKRLLIFLQIIIQLCPNKQDADADIQPQHQDYNRSQASVHIGIVAEIIKIDRKQGGENDPPGSAEKGSRYLASHTVLSHRNQGVEAGKNKDQKPQCRQGTEVK